MVSAPHDPVTVPTRPLQAPASPTNAKTRSKGRGRFNKGRTRPDDLKPAPTSTIEHEEIDSPTRRRGPANEADHLLRSPVRVRFLFYVNEILSNL